MLVELSVVEQRYQAVLAVIRDGVSVPKQTQSVADTRLVGKAEMTIDFTNVSLDPKRTAVGEDAQ
jgi:hypothetical protein